MVDAARVVLDEAAVGGFTLGRGQLDASAQGGALRADLSFPEDVTVAADGSVLIADSGNARIRRAAVGLPGYGDAELSIPSEDGTEVYQFNRDGRHLRTLEALTGTLRWSFAYDDAGRLTSVTDGDGNRTDIVRDGTGAATAIVAPGDVRTELANRADGFLGSIANPAGEAVTLPLLYAMVVAASVAWSLDSPSRAALLPTLVPRREFPRAVTIASTAQALAFATGPAACGLVIGTAGVAEAYAAVGVTDVALRVSMSDIPIELARRSITLAGEHVLPRFR